MFIGKVCLLGGTLVVSGRVLHRVLRFSCDLRAPGALRQPGGAQRLVVPRTAGRATQARQTAQGEPQERVQAPPRLQLHHSHAHRRRHCVPLH